MVKEARQGYQGVGGQSLDLSNPPTGGNATVPTPRALRQTLMQEWRCPNCGRKLADMILGPGSMVSVKCERCKTLNVREAATY